MVASSHAQFELHDLDDASTEVLNSIFSPREQPRAVSTVLAVVDDGPMWIGFRDDDRRPQRVDRPELAHFGVMAVQRKIARELALVPVRDGVLVNSIPALGLTLLGTRDSISAGPNKLLYVTLRVRPHIGQPTDEMVAARAKCPFCKLPITSKETFVVTCAKCGSPFHHETQETCPHVPAEERLNCIEKVSTCLACGQMVTLEETLLWDPVTL